MISEICIGFVALLLYFYYALSKNKNYWSDREIPSTTFKFLWGDTRHWVFREETARSWALRTYNKFYDQPFFGAWQLFGAPMLVINKDFDLIRSIFIKDFDHFQRSLLPLTKSIWPSSRHEKIMLRLLGSLAGDEWKHIRFVALTFSNMCFHILYL